MKRKILDRFRKKPANEAIGKEVGDAWQGSGKPVQEAISKKYPVLPEFHRS